MLSDNGPFSPRDSREVGSGDFELQPKKHVNYNYPGSNRAIAGHRRNAPSPVAGKQGALAPFKAGGTQLSFKGDALASPLYSDGNANNAASMRSMPRVEETHASADSQPAAALNSFVHYGSTKDTALNNSAGVHSGDIIPIKT